MPTATDLVRNLIVGSPLANLLGITLDVLESDSARLRLPFRQELTTIDDIVHGGAIASLIDTTATAAAWSRTDPSAGSRGTTVGFSVNFLGAARGRDLIAAARVIRRGKTICVCDVSVQDDAGSSIARALVTYKLN